jgi:hypothetical protein
VVEAAGMATTGHCRKKDGISTKCPAKGARGIAKKNRELKKSVSAEG